MPWTITKILTSRISFLLSKCEDLFLFLISQEKNVKEKTHWFWVGILCANFWGWIILKIRFKKYAMNTTANDSSTLKFEIFYRSWCDNLYTYAPYHVNGSHICVNHFQTDLNLDPIHLSEWAKVISVVT